MILLFFSGALLVWSIWQHELMMLGWMAQNWNSTFTLFSGITLQWGKAYDYTLLTEFAAFILGLCALWFWND
jgi:hypothetical protein